MISNLILFVRLVAKVGWMCGWIPGAIVFLYLQVSGQVRKPNTDVVRNGDGLEPVREAMREAA